MSSYQRVEEETVNSEKNTQITERAAVNTYMKIGNRMNFNSPLRNDDQGLENKESYQLLIQRGNAVLGEDEANQIFHELSQEDGRESINAPFNGQIILEEA